jgi:cell shape-determining protein MreD
MLLSFVLLFISLILESSLTTIPLTFIVLLCLTVVYKDNFVFFLAFVFGVFLDILSFNTIGVSSIFFISSIFLVLIYQKKFEITTYPFVLIASFIGSISFLLLLGFSDLIIIQSVVSSLLAVLLFHVLRKNIKLTKISSVNI